MNENIISKLYNGKLYPASIPLKKTERLISDSKECSELQLQIYNLLLKEDKDMICKYTDCIENKNSYINDFAFENGFSHGIQIIMEALGNK